jgi:hypothetical protein
MGVRPVAVTEPPRAGRRDVVTGEKMGDGLEHPKAVK